MCNFILGVFTGNILTVILFACLQVAGKSDE